MLHGSVMLDGVYTKISSHYRVQQTQTCGSAELAMAAAPSPFSLLTVSILSFLSNAKVYFLLLLPRIKTWHV